MFIKYLVRICCEQGTALGAEAETCRYKNSGSLSIEKKEKVLNTGISTVEFLHVIICSVPHTGHVILDNTLPLSHSVPTCITCLCYSIVTN